LNLRAKQRKELFNALLGAFTPSDFDRLLLHNLDKKRYEIVSSSEDFKDVLDKVIEDAEKNNWLRELVDEALKERSTNEALQKFVEEFRPPAPAALPTYAHILFISMLGETANGPCDIGPVLPSQQFDLIRAEALKQQTIDPALLISEVKDQGIVLTTFGGAAALLKLAVDVATMDNSPGVGRLQMGIHSVVCANQGNGQPSQVPPEGVEIARRITRLGNDGHILATREAAERIKAESTFKEIFAAAFDDLFHGPWKCETRPFLNKDIYSIYLTHVDGDRQQTVFGSESPPKRKAPEGVIKETRVPATIRLMKEEKIKVVFCPEVSYAKVQFTFENTAGSDINISSDKTEGPDCTFEFDFEDPQELREHLFILNAINTTKNHNFLLKMQCYDRQGEQIIRPREWPIKLRRNFWLWLWEIIWHWPWWLRASLPVVVSLAVLLYFAVCNRPRPICYGEDKNWVDNFDAQEIKNLEERWDFQRGQIEPEYGEEVGPEERKTEPKAGAILITTPGMVLGKVDGPGVLCDFKVTFKMSFVNGTKAAWVLRAQSDKQRGYVFVLEQSGKNLILNGYKSLNWQDKFDNLFRPVPIATCCEHGDVFEVTAEIKGSMIKHSIRVENLIPREGINRPDPDPILPDFTDGEARYPYGSFGFVGLDDSQMKAEFWYLNPKQFAAAPVDNSSSNK
jgi:hypothetical protein